jgi:hypothetical protein
MLQASFGSNVIRGLRQLPIAQRRQQVPGDDHAPTAFLIQSLSGREVGALLHGLLGVAPEDQVAQHAATADQLLVEPCGADYTGLPLDRQVRFPFCRHPAEALRVALAAKSPGTFHSPSATRSTMSSFRPADKGRDKLLRVTARHSPPLCHGGSSGTRRWSG